MDLLQYFSIYVLALEFPPRQTPRLNTAAAGKSPISLHRHGQAALRGLAWGSSHLCWLCDGTSNCRASEEGSNQPCT